MKTAKDIAAGVASLALVLAAQAAQAAQGNGPTIYGQLNLSVDQLDNGTQGALNVSSNSSRLGVNGEVPVSEGVAGIYQIESEVNADTGNTSSNNTAFASRNTFAGLQSFFGTVRVGRFDTPVKELSRAIDLFKDQVGDTRNLTRGSNSDAQFDERANNSVAYTTPAWSGLSASLQYSSNLSNTATGTDDTKLLSATANYTVGPAFLGLGYERHGLAQGTPGSNPDAVRLAGYYDIGAWRITALWQSISGTDSSKDEDTYGAGVRFVTGPWTFKTQAYQLDSSSTGKDATMVAVGAEYALQKAITLYADYGAVDNDASQKLNPYKEGRSDNLASANAGDTATGISLGTIIKF